MMPYHKLVIDCECSEGLEGECYACEREALEQGIDHAMMEAEEENYLEYA